MKTSYLASRLTFCDECGYWKPSSDKRLKEESRGCIGICNRPCESMVERYEDDFCSRGVKKKEDA